MPRGWASPGTAYMIRDFLRIVGESWPKRVHNELAVWAKNAGYRPPSYPSIRNFFWALRHLGFIEKVREEPVPGHPTAFPRAIYRLVPGTEDDPRWRDPVTAHVYPRRRPHRRPSC